MKKHILLSSKKKILKRIEISILCGIVLASAFSTTVFGTSCDGIRQRILRLHILANSDSEEDQAVKLKVRDAVLQEGKRIFDGSVTAKDAESILSAEKEQLESVANRVLLENGFSYTAKIEVGKSFFTTRSYENKVTLPAGEYTAIRILLGDAAGHNWWCVMFPPMCLPAAGEDVQIDNVLSDSQEKLVESNPKYEMRFKIVEIFEKILEKTK